MRKYHSDRSQDTRRTHSGTSQLRVWGSTAVPPDDLGVAVSRVTIDHDLLFGLSI